MNNNPEEKKQAKIPDEAPAADNIAADDATILMPAVHTDEEAEDMVKTTVLPAVSDGESSDDEYLEDMWDDETEAQSDEEAPADGEADDTEDEDDEDASKNEAESQVHKKKRRNTKRRRTMKLSFALITTALIFGVSIILAVFILMLGKDFVGLGKSDALTVFTIEKDATTAEIAQQLYEHEIIEVPTLFRLISKLSGKDGLFQVGEHYLRPSMAYEAILAELTSNTIETAEERETVTIMFREGITLQAAAQMLEEYGVCDADDFIWTFNAKSFDYSFETMINSANMKFYKKEGFFFPDTYTFYVKSTPEVVCTTIAYNFSKKFTDKYLRRMEELNMTLDEVITLASIIQAEVGNATEMKKVSSVFHNRLDNPVGFPLLQSDATTNYVNNVIKEYAAVLSKPMCDAYNTYTSSGLPPGAINNPGIDAIEAALYPDDTDYYFFCSDTSGKYYYAKTNAEHEANYARALEAGGYSEETTTGDENAE